MKWIILLLFGLLSFTVSSDEDTYSVNLHIVKLDDLESLIYGQSSSTARTLSSRSDAEFNAVVNDERQRETYSIDHVLAPGEKPHREGLTVTFKKFVKVPCQTCQGVDLHQSSLESTMKLLLKDDSYLRFAQHSDREQMSDPATHQFKFHREIKNGSPIKPVSCIFFSHSTLHKTLAYRLNRWLKKASQENYLQAHKGHHHGLKTMENASYQDFLLGTYCRTGIMEVVLHTKDRGHLPGLIFFDYHLGHALVLEVLPQQTQTPLMARAKTKVSTSQSSESDKPSDEDPCKKLAQLSVSTSSLAALAHEASSQGSHKNDLNSLALPSLNFTLNTIFNDCGLDWSFSSFWQ